MNLSQLFTDRCHRFAEQPALTDDSGTLSFDELSRNAHTLAGGMQRDLGIGPGDRVLIWMSNCRSFVETLFATWAAGACAVPVNAKLHPRELEHIVKDSQPKALFTTPEGAAELNASGSGIVAATAVIASESASYSSLQAGPPIGSSHATKSDPAWIFYTSGTTGFPKGAILSHHTLLFMGMTYYADIEYVAPGQTMLHAAPLSHGSGLYMLPHLLAGGHQIIMRHFDAAAVVQAMGEHPAVSMFVVPTMLTRMAQAARAIPGWQGQISSLIYGGAPMYVSDLMEAMDVLGTNLYQLFGQGETPMTATGLSRFEHAKAYAERDLAALATTGGPRYGLQIRIVDEAGQELPSGQAGEILVRGDSVMLGYWNNPQATAKTLRDGWLWTGDIGRLDSRGRLELIDRSKDMIISGGSNIYPREVEETLLTHPAIDECSVIGRAHPDMGEEVVAFIVCHPGRHASPEDLDQLCLGNLARYKRPRAYRYIDALPKSSYGKILKNTLRDLLKDE